MSAAVQLAKQQPRAKSTDHTHSQKKRRYPARKRNEISSAKISQQLVSPEKAGQGSPFNLIIFKDTNAGIAFASNWGRNNLRFLAGSSLVV